MTLKELRKMREAGEAQDLTTTDPKDLSTDLDTVELSFGVYGMNGGLFKSRRTGQLYVITARNSNLFRLA